MPRREWLAVAAIVATVGGCAHSRGPTAAAGAWRALEHEARPFVALYDLDCCARRDLLCTVRASEESLDLTVVARPGAVVLRVWAEPGQSWLFDGESRCRTELPAGIVPLGEDLDLPVSPAVLHAILAGTVPAGGSDDPSAPGWVAGAVDTWRWRALPAEHPTRLERFAVTRSSGARDVVLEARLDEHRLGTIPGRIRLTLGGRSAELKLRSFSWAERVVRPAWLDSPVCVSRP